MSAAPYTPTNVEPPNGAENVSLTPTLISSDFSDPDPDDVHQASQWQIADLLRDFSTPIFDSGTDTDNLISITIPTGILRYDAFYYLRVRYQDDDGAWSNFSTPTKFKTTPRLLGDVSGNGDISAYDAALILQYCVGLIDHFPCENLTAAQRAVPANYTITIPEVSAKIGDQVSVPISINNADNLTAGAISVKYDRSVLRVVKVTPEPLLNGAYWKSNVIEENGEIRFAFAMLDQTGRIDLHSSTDSGHDGECPLRSSIMQIEFELIGNVEDITTDLKIGHVEIAESLSIRMFDGSITFLPQKSALLQNYPNPFNPETWIPYQLAKDADVHISIYDLQGRLVKMINLGKKSAGSYITKSRAAYWDGRNSRKEKVSSGVYFYHLQADDYRATKRMLIIK